MTPSFTAHSPGEHHWKLPDRPRSLLPLHMAVAADPSARKSRDGVDLAQLGMTRFLRVPHGPLPIRGTCLTHLRLQKTTLPFHTLCSPPCVKGLLPARGCVSCGFSRSPPSSSTALRISSPVVWACNVTWNHLKASPAHKGPNPCPGASVRDSLNPTFRAGPGICAAKCLE